MEPSCFDLESYFQSRYDFESQKLNQTEIREIKTLANEKRVEYGIAPIGINIFRFLSSKEYNLQFEQEPFNSKSLDALIYLPSPNMKTAYIILNSTQPLLNQIFATAHEYYHYIVDIEELKNKPFLCSLSDLSDKREQKASRFAAEFLLPDKALKNSIDKFSTVFGTKVKDCSIEDFASLCSYLTIIYCLPLKAVIYRLYEENYISNIKKYLSNYEFMKSVFNQFIKKNCKEAQMLLEANNPYIDEVLYDLMGIAYERNFLSSEEIERDAEILNLQKDLLRVPFTLEENSIDDEEIDDEEIDDIKERLLSQKKV